MRATRWADTHRSPRNAPGLTHGGLFVQRRCRFNWIRCRRCGCRHCGCLIKSRFDPDENIAETSCVTLQQIEVSRKPKHLPCIHCRLLVHRFHCQAVCRRKAFTGETNPGGLVAFAAIWVRGQVGSICFDQQPIKRHGGGDDAHLFVFSKCQHPGE